MKTAIRVCCILLIITVLLICGTLVFLEHTSWGFSTPMSVSEAALRSQMILSAENWLGTQEGDENHTKILDIYNTHLPLAQGYMVTDTDNWCATFASAIAIDCNLTDIIPTECGCQRQITLWQELGRWEENDNYMPNPGDYIYYAWDERFSFGDCTGWADHVGIVEKVSGNVIVVIEGNHSNSVKRRTLKINAKNIRGYCVPKFDKVEATPVEPVKPAEPAPAKPTEPTPSVKNVKATDPAKGKNEKIAGSYVTTANLHMRNGAGKNKKVMTVIPKNTKVKNYGFYTDYYGTRWLYVQVTLDKVVYSGFCSSNYLDKI
jgi:hypothetical protein